MSEEVWKDVEGMDKYQVSNTGLVRNKKTNCLMHQKIGRDGHYLSVYLTNNGHENTYRVHRLVAEAFLGKQPGMMVNHIDGNKLNNHVDNLEWCTARENNLHAIKTGLNHPGAYQKRPIRVVETGEIFDGVCECAEAVGADFRNVYAALQNEKRHTANGLHFEYVDEIPEKKRQPFLYDYQLDAVNRLHNGCILCGSVGSGKSRTGLFYYFKENGGWIDEYGYVPMKNPKDLIIITTAKKRDSLEWEGELAYFLMTTKTEDAYYDHTVTINSWNNIGKYKDVEGKFILLDEQRLVSSGAWVKAFLKMAKHNDWILLSATPGDTYSDYLPVFLANGFFKNKTEFNREHVIYSRFTKYPKIDRYINTQRLDRLCRGVLVQMDYKHEIDTYHEDVYCQYDISLYKDTIRNRWDYFKNEPIADAGGLCFVLRKIVNTDESRQVAVLELLENIPRAIIFYSFDYEREILLNLGYMEGTEVAEWSGHSHQPIPKSDRWVYLCQYTSASEGWECIRTNTVIFYSQNYSYKVTTQAAGRVDRLNTPYTELKYYHLKSRSGIDLAISKALKEKKKFNETKFAKW